MRAPHYRIPGLAFQRGRYNPGMTKSASVTHLRGTAIDAAHSDAFAMHAARLIVTADDAHWLDAAAQAACGYGSSIIGCDAEVGVELHLEPEDTPDRRSGLALLFFARSEEKLVAAVRNRTGQCLMTCPTTMVFDGLPERDARFGLGSWVRYFGDGFEEEARRGGRAGYVIPVTAGEFFCEAQVGVVTDAVAGGTLLLGGDDHARLLDAAREAVEAIGQWPGVITPFPGGVCRCGSKVGGRTHPIIATTNDAYCPTLRDRVETKLPADVRCVYEIVIDGLTRDAVVDAMRAGIEAAAGPGVNWISSASIGGELGTVRITLRELVNG